MMGMLQGVKILDLTSVLMGPYASQTLGDYGADIIKVEAPGGDITRQIGPVRNDGMGPVFLNANRNKRSIALDLKHPKGREALLRLARTADVVLYNIRPQAMERLGLGYAAFQAENPGIIYAGVFGFSQDGPYARKPAYDDLIQGASTIASLMTASGSDRPRYVPNAMADRTVGLFAVTGILAALHQRTRTGEGTRLDFPMFETMVSFIMSDHMGGQTFDPPLDKGGYGRQLSPYRRPFQTSDGYICTLIYTDKQWQSYARATGQEAAMSADPRLQSMGSRLKDIDAIYAELEAQFLERSTAEWTQLLTDADIPTLPMHSLETIFDDEHLAAVDFFPVIDHPTEGKLRTIRFPVNSSNADLPDQPAPTYGQHSVEILREAGYSDAAIAELTAEGAAGPTPTRRT